jgi:hypothetical protein
MPFVPLSENVRQRERCDCMTGRKTLATKHSRLKPRITVGLPWHINWPNPAVDHFHCDGDNLRIGNGLSC